MKVLKLTLLFVLVFSGISAFSQDKQKDKNKTIKQKDSYLLFELGVVYPELEFIDSYGAHSLNSDAVNISSNRLAIGGGGVKKVALTTYWSTGGNTGTAAGTHFLGTTDAKDVVFKTNALERFRIKSDGSRALFANPGDFSMPGLSPTAVLGIDGTNHSRLRLTAGDAETFDDTKGASIDLHGNTSTANSGVLDLVAGQAASGTSAAIKFWTNTTGAMGGQQTSAVITGEGNMGLGVATPSEKLEVDGNIEIVNGALILTDTVTGDRYSVSIASGSLVLTLLP